MATFLEIEWLRHKAQNALIVVLLAAARTVFSVAFF